MDVLGKYPGKIGHKVNVQHEKRSSCDFQSSRPRWVYSDSKNAMESIMDGIRDRNTLCPLMYDLKACARPVIRCKCDALSNAISFSSI